MTFFCADFHFCHRQSFLYEPRGFSCVEDMNKQIVKNFNSILTDDDILYVLGDCVMNNNEEGIEYLKQIKGHKFLAYGNHDTDNKIKLYQDNHIFEDIQMGYKVKHRHKLFICTHYPTLTGNTNESNVFNLCGHIHTKDKFLQIKDAIYHVELDATGLMPVSIDTICDDIVENRAS